MIAGSTRLLVAGIGCTSAATAEEVIALIEMALATARRPAAHMACLATIDTRANAGALQFAASHFGVPMRTFSAADLAAESSRLASPSAIVADLAGLPGIAEAVALKAGTLVVTKQKSAHATCAIGLAATPFDVMRFGRGVAA